MEVSPLFCYDDSISQMPGEARRILGAYSKTAPGTARISVARYLRFTAGRQLVSTDVQRRMIV